MTWKKVTTDATPDNPTKCTECDGSGRVPHRDCATCNAVGFIGDRETGKRKCPTCYGSGQSGELRSRPCSYKDHPYVIHDR